MEDRSYSFLMAPSYFTTEESNTLFPLQAMPPRLLSQTINALPAALLHYTRSANKEVEGLVASVAAAWKQYRSAEDIAALEVAVSRHSALQLFGRQYPSAMALLTLMFCVEWRHRGPRIGSEGIPGSRILEDLVQGARPSDSGNDTETRAPEMAYSRGVPKPTLVSPPAHSVDAEYKPSSRSRGSDHELVSPPRKGSVMPRSFSCSMIVCDNGDHDAAVESAVENEASHSLFLFNEFVYAVSDGRLCPRVQMRCVKVDEAKASETETGPQEVGGKAGKEQALSQVQQQEEDILEEGIMGEVLSYLRQALPPAAAQWGSSTDWWLVITPALRIATEAHPATPLHQAARQARGVYSFSVQQLRQRMALPPAIQGFVVVIPEPLLYSNFSSKQTNTAQHASFVTEAVLRAVAVHSESLRGDGNESQGKAKGSGSSSGSREGKEPDISPRSIAATVSPSSPLDMLMAAARSVLALD